MARSDRAARMERRHRRAAVGRLNLISLMDIFTILVFFLLVNSSEVEVLPNGKSIAMPESIAEQKPRETLTVMVTDTQILLQGQPVVTIAEALAGAGRLIPELERALGRRGTNSLPPAEGAARELTIMGDKHIPYRLLRKVMATCTEADFARISLAVLQKGAAQAT